MRKILASVLFVFIILPGVALGDCATVGGNLITNCNFVVGIASWTQFTGTFSPNAAQGSNAAGSMQIVSTLGVGVEEAETRQCISGVLGSTTYGYGIDHRSLTAADCGSWPGL